MWLILTGLPSSYALSVMPRSYKFSKFFVTIQHPWNAPFWGRSGLYLPQILPDFAKVFTTGSIQGNKNSALGIFENSFFLQKREIPRVYTFGPNLIPFSLWRSWPNLKQNNVRGKNSLTGLSKSCKVKTCLFSPSTVK